MRSCNLLWQRAGGPKAAAAACGAAADGAEPVAVGDAWQAQACGMEGGGAALAADQLTLERVRGEADFCGSSLALGMKWTTYNNGMTKHRLKVDAIAQLL